MIAKVKVVEENQCKVPSKHIGGFIKQLPFRNINSTRKKIILPRIEVQIKSIKTVCSFLFTSKYFEKFDH